MPRLEPQRAPAPASPPAVTMPSAPPPERPKAGPEIVNSHAVGASLPPAEITTLLSQGDDAFRQGDLTSARLYYLRAFDAGDGRGALGIGASYDPEFLRRFHLRMQRPNPAEARIWYLRARTLGAAGAEARLAKLK